MAIDDEAYTKNRTKVLYQELDKDFIQEVKRYGLNPSLALASTIRKTPKETQEARTKYRASIEKAIAE